MKDYDKNKESSYLKYWDVTDLYGWEMPQKLPVNSFEQVKHNFELKEDFIKNYNEEKDEGYFPENDVQYPKKQMNFIMTYHFYLKKRNLKKMRSFQLICMIKLNMLCT